MLELSKIANVVYMKTNAVRREFSELRLIV